MVAILNINRNLSSSSTNKRALQTTIPGLPPLQMTGQSVLDDPECFPKHIVGKIVAAGRR